MAIGEKLFTRLSTYAGLTALVATRVYPQIMPQGVTYPAVVYDLTGAYREPAMGSDTGIVRSYWQVSAYSESYATSKGVATQIRLALERWRDEVGSSVLDCFATDEIDDYDPDARAYYSMMEFEVFYRE